MKLRSVGTMLKKINLNDKARALITEFTPFETPLIFSNTGFYQNFCNFESLPIVIKSILAQEKNSYTVPYAFKIDKDSNSERRLALIHPIIQMEMLEFYNENNFRIIDSCGLSPCSLRRPKSLASKYSSSKYEKIDTEIKSELVDTIDMQDKTSYQNSYFAYEKFAHINFFTSSNDFLNIEGDFKFLLRLDIQSCFESIYTHSICWAVKDKKFSKSNSSRDNFENNFDKLMQRANYNETNGIVVGPEVSRIFSEIILQKIDNCVINEFTEKGYRFGVDYIFYRYVDDYFIFSNSKDTLKEIESVLSDILFEYKLSKNESKRVLQKRPFYTSKDIAIDKVRRLIKELNFSITDLITLEDIKLRRPKLKRKDKEGVVASTIREIKSITSEENVNINDLSPYIIKSIKNLIFNHIDISHRYSMSFSKDDFDYLSIYLDILLYFYSLDRRTTVSFSFCLTIIILVEFIKKTSDVYQIYFNDKISHFLRNKIITSLDKLKESNKVEFYNIVLTLQHLNGGYEATADTISESTINKIPSLTYFDYITLLYYSGKSSSLSNLKVTLIDSLENYIENLCSSDGFILTELMHMYLDYLSCPHIDDQRKTNLSMKIMASDSFKKKAHTAGYAIPRSKKKLSDDIMEAIEFSKSNFWFTNWNNLDIRKILLKKELSPTY
ncbi:antiviral reverse transcriptase Drt3b [Shewanella sedimentimangrovi]|uniref:RNA-directed DNA polymerase n=1 Tax=Shewanella sedimentimangrovi TaxID=2814293 RepID=A0ABX7QYZ1_9GAMM|nr:antiviral reverse transcriptase Drt3b [Shewanella sedimentimangrovi]QSX36736.1 RNA-directed DNA polymerase [Shewanella sedimentimangrovi]